MKRVENTGGMLGSLWIWGCVGGFFADQKIPFVSQKGSIGEVGGGGADNMC